MKHNYRWTVRNLDPEALQILHEAQELNPQHTLGALVSTAIRDWWDNLPDETETEYSDGDGIDFFR